MYGLKRKPKTAFAPPPRRKHPRLTRRAASSHGWLKGGVLGLVGLALCLIVVGIDYAHLGEKMWQRVVALTHKHGLVIDDILIEGRFYAEVEDVKTAIGLSRGDPLFLHSPAFLKQRLEALPWIRSACVQRVLPNLIYVRLAERRPIAVWQNRGRHFLVDGDGKIIDSDKVPLFQHLPLIVGPAAPQAAAPFLKLLGKYPELQAQVKAATRVGQRRWDLHLKNGMKILLPEEKTAQALADLMQLQAKKNLLSRDINTLDLRVPDRLILGLPLGVSTSVRYRTKNPQKPL